MITVELVKLLRLPRTWISVVLTCALPFMVAVFITITHLVPPPGQGSAFLSAVLQDGALYPAAALALVLPVFLPVAVAVVAGDSIAGEATGGTLRYLLVRPVGRTRLLVAKLVSVTVYVLLVVLAVTFTAYATGSSCPARPRPRPSGRRRAFPAGGGRVAPGLAGQAPTAGQAAGGAVTSLSGAPLSLLQLTERTAVAIAFITVSMLGVAAIALFLSTITDSALGSALGALAALVASEVLVTLNAATVVQPYLPTGTGWPGSTSSGSPSSGPISSAGSGSRRSTSWCCWPPRGRTSPPRTSPRDRRLPRDPDQWVAAGRHVPGTRTQATPAPSASRFGCAGPAGTP